MRRAATFLRFRGGFFSWTKGPAGLSFARTSRKRWRMLYRFDPVHRKETLQSCPVRKTGRYIKIFGHTE
jgi:hypothetical protein